MQTLQKTCAAIALMAALCGGAQASIVNGNFDANLGGWTTLGDASVQGGRLLLTTATIAPDDVDALGNPVASLNRSGTDAVDAGVLASSAGLAAGALDPSAFAFATEGALASQSFNGSAGQTLSFLWNFGTRDSFADYAFFVLDGVLTQLASVADATLAGSGDKLFETGDRSFSLTLGRSGMHSLAFGVVDVNDTAVTSSLAVDRVQLGTVNAVPEPGSLALLTMGLGLLAWRQRRPS